MKIIINATQQASHITGTDRVAYNVLRELQAIDTSNQYTVLCTRGFDFIPSAITGPNFSIRYRRLLRHRLNLLAAAPWRLGRQLWVKYVTRPGVYCSFQNMQTPRIKCAPTVADALDLIPLIFSKEYHRDAMDEQAYTARLHRARKTADHFIAISEFTKQDLVTRLGIPPSKITTMPLAAEARFSEPVTVEQRIAARHRYKLPDTYVVTIGANEPRKNTRAVIMAHAKLPIKLQRQYPLVIMGVPWRNTPIDTAGDTVQFTGYVDDADLPALYQMASAFAFLSYYEGFGLPVLEAMSAGCPVVCADNSSLPEVAGKAAVLVPADDTAAAAQALETLLTDETFAQKLRRDGMKQAAQFSWKCTARIFHEVLLRTAQVKS